MRIRRNLEWIKKEEEIKKGIKAANATGGRKHRKTAYKIRLK